MTSGAGWPAPPLSRGTALCSETAMGLRVRFRLGQVRCERWGERLGEGQSPWQSLARAWSEPKAVPWLHRTERTVRRTNHPPRRCRHNKAPEETPAFIRSTGLRRPLT